MERMRNFEALAHFNSVLRPTAGEKCALSGRPASHLAVLGCPDQHLTQRIANDGTVLRGSVPSIDLTATA